MDEKLVSAADVVWFEALFALANSDTRSFLVVCRQREQMYVSMDYYSFIFAVLESSICAGKR